jgi:hypothetical protein
MPTVRTLIDQSLRVQPWASTRRDPYAFLAALERERVTSVIIDSLACDLPGADEITRGDRPHQLDAGRELRRLDLTVENVDARRADRREPSTSSSTVTSLSAPPSTTREQRSWAEKHTRVLLGRERCGYVIPSA